MRSTVVRQLLEVHGADPRPESPGRRLLVIEPDDVGEILHSTAFQRTDFVRQLAGSGLLATDGPLWRERRRIMQPSFPVREPERHLESIDWAMPGFIDRLGCAVDEDRRLCLLDEMMRVISRIVYRAVFGVELRSDEDRVSKFQPMMDAVGAVHWSLVAPGGTVSAAALSQLQRTRSLADEEIAWIIQRRRGADVGVDDALGRLLSAQAEGRIDDEGIHDEVRSLVLAATETSANSLVWCLLLLEDHPEVIERIAPELAAGRGEAELDAVIWETLRLYPPVWANERQAVETAVQGDRTWEPGDRAVISAYRLHRDPRLWNDPDLFRPERFAASSEGRWKPPHRFAYMPFGAGPHLCIGRNLALLEMRRILREIISGFRVEFESPGEIEPILGIVMRPSAPVSVRLRRR
ncbi:MAG: cytochrome P450 [Phycisphaera sp. TMED9]|nr:MAG: cytochrome P450 [Phycisphaera sp. TMED9]